MDQVKKRQLKKILGWIAIVLVICLLASVPILARSNAEPAGRKGAVLSGKVAIGTIETVLRGGGTLKASEAEDVTIDTGMKLARYLVSDGDAVVTGDPVAELDRLSIMSAITQVQNKLDNLKRSINIASAEEVTQELKALAGGRVKAIYAQEGDYARDVMLEKGALAVLSLDGRMAVVVNCTSSLSVGDAVTVVFANGTRVDGVVESDLDDTLIVSLEDENYAIGEPVTVYAGDTELGRGELQIHSAWYAVGWSGIVESVEAELEETVDAGTVLMTLTDPEDSTELEKLLEQHREYEEQLQELFRLYDNPVITADHTGVVTGVDADSTLLVANDSTMTDYSREAVPILSVIPQEIVTVTITLDERDIGKVRLGQTAQVQIDALKDQTFEAVVSSVGTKGSNRGGSSKFTVELTMPRAENMLSGMRASASISLDIAKNVATVPVAALCEVGSKTVIYTGCDRETGELMDPVEVTTGVSDGITVELLSGLKTGENYYYSYFEAPDGE